MPAMRSETGEMTNALAALLRQLQEIWVVEVVDVEVEEPAPNPPYAWTPAYPGEEPPF